MLKELFSTEDIHWRTRASAYHYRTISGRLTFAMFLMMGLAVAVLSLMEFPVRTFLEAMWYEDNFLLDTLDAYFTAPVNIILGITALMTLFLSFLGILGLIMRLHDFGRSGWWIIPLFLTGSVVDGLLISTLQFTSLPILTYAITLFFLYKEADSEENNFGEQAEENRSLSMLLVSFIPVVYVGIEAALTLLSQFEIL